MIWSDENIVFIFSLPRSGSTLLQRMLVKHSKVASTSESWILLPQIYAFRENCTFSEYSQTAASRALNDFCDCLPGGKSKYLGHIKLAVMQSFSEAAGENIIYLEKTPRNLLILEEIVHMFPNSKYIFLWRNPASIVSSMINSFADGKWNLYRQEIDLFAGLENMLKADKLNIPHRIDLNYEDLVTDPSSCTQKLMDFIGVDVEINGDALIANKFSGRMGDPTGIKKYSDISTNSIDNWAATFCNPLRRRWLNNYIEHIGNENLIRMGYDIQQIRAKLYSQKGVYSRLLSDALRMVYGCLDREFHLSIILRLRKKNKGRRKYSLQ